MVSGGTTMKQTFEAKVTKVVDGDTFDAIVTQTFFDVTLTKTIRVRMLGIDAPELHGNKNEKEAGLKTKKWLQDRIEGKTVRLDIDSTDMYDRYLSTVFENNENINQKLIDLKLVEVYSPQTHNDGILEV
jgi:endonuclease YncB( thermonuclease family)